MGKGRMTVLDLAAATKELRKSLIGSRLANIYDLNPKTFLFKFARSEEKHFLLMESGIRIHLTKYSREKNNTPNGFCMKLRKHIRTKLLHDIQQMGSDRVLILTFGSGENAFHVILELYAGGNIILTDFDFTILSLLRPYELETDSIRVAVGEKFPVNFAPQPAPIDASSLTALWKKALENPKNKTIADIFPPGSPFSPVVIEHCLQQAGVDPKSNLRTLWNGQGAFDKCDALVDALSAALPLLQSIADQPLKGYLVVQPPAAIKSKPAEVPATEPAEPEVNYSEFIPYLFSGMQKLQTREFPTFNEAVDEFFTRLEASKESARLVAQEAAAWSKVERIRDDHQQRISQLEQAQHSAEHKARLVEHHHEMIDQAMLAVRQALAAGMDWNALSNLIREERRQGNPVAAWIKELKLEQNKITLAVPNQLPEDVSDESESNSDSNSDSNDSNSDEEDESDDEPAASKKKAAKKKSAGKPTKVPFVNIDVDLSLTANANASTIFSSKKKSADKQQRTEAATSKALKAAEVNTRKTLAALEKQQRIAKLRKVFWFEKFHWFITSENYLVVGGKDAQQNETLVKRYLKKHDAYIHADIHGASSVIVKNSGEGPIPPLSLQQASLMTISRSSAWEAKVLTTAYWVNAHQVSKTAPSGEYLGTGSFMIRGKRNLIPAAPLVMGLGILFRLDPSTMAHHIGERRVRGFGDTTDRDDLESIADSDVGFAKSAASSLAAPLPEEDETVALDDEPLSDHDDAEADAEEVPTEAAQPVLSSDSEDEAPAMDVTSALFASASNMPQVFNIGVFRGAASTPSASSSTTTPSASTAASVKPSSGDSFAAAMTAVSGGTAQERAEARVMLAAASSTWNPDAALAEEDPDDPFAAQPSAANNRRRLTAAQRRYMKKHGSLDGFGEKDSDDDVKPEPVAAPAAAPAVKPPAAKTTPSLASLPRGKRAKMKRLKGKFDDQSDEERELMSKLLGTKLATEEAEASASSSESEVDVKSKSKPAKKGGKPDPKKDDSKTSGKAAKATTASTKAAAKPESKDMDADFGSKSCFICHQKGHVSRDCQQKPADKSVKEVITEARQREEAEINQIMAEENIAFVADEDKATLTELDSLTGKPLPTDMLHFAIPVCAPWAALTDYKYKVKLVPGSSKRGAVAKGCMHAFLHHEAINEKEKDLTKAIPDNDVFSVLLSNVKVASALARGASNKKDKRKGK